MPRRTATTANRTSKSDKAGLRFPVGRIKSMLLSHEHGQRVSDTAAVYMTAVLEYVTAEVLELSLRAAREAGNTRIQPHHVNAAFREDRDFVRQFKTAIVPRSRFVATADGPVASGGRSSQSRAGKDRGTSKKASSKSRKTSKK